MLNSEMRYTVYKCHGCQSLVVGFKCMEFAEDVYAAHNDLACEYCDTPLSYGYNAIDVIWRYPHQLMDLNPEILCPKCSSINLEYNDESCDMCGEQYPEPFWDALSDVAFEAVVEAATKLTWKQNNLLWCCNLALTSCECEHRVTEHSVQSMLEVGAIGYAPDSYCTNCLYQYTAFCPMLRVAALQQVEKVEQLDNLYGAYGRASWNDLIPIAIDGCSLVPNLVEAESLSTDEVIGLDYANIPLTFRGRKNAAKAFDKQYIPPEDPLKLKEQSTSG